MTETPHNPNCACCGAGRNLAFIFEKEDEDIATHGFHYSAVLGNEENPGFVYTSGLAEKGLPEFIFIGSSKLQAAKYLSSFIAAAMAGEETPIGLVPPETPQNPYMVPVYVVEAPERLDTHAYGVKSRLTRAGSQAEPRLLQVIMPDLSGRFPWDPGYKWLNQLVTERPNVAAG